MYRRKQARDRLRGGPGWGDCRCPTDSHSIDRIADYFDKRVRDQVDGDEAPPGPSPVSLGLLELLSDVGDAQPTVLDLGCGTGASSVRLMQEGARQVMGLDASPASVELARSRATSAGLNETVARFRVGDAATMTLPRHDWVLLDRVVCCYQDSHSLLANAAGAAEQRIAISVPESRSWRGMYNAATWTLENVGKAATRRSACRGYVHDVRSIQAQLEEAGFQQLREGRHWTWYLAVFERSHG